MSFIFICTLNLDRIFVANVIADNESPPRSNKLSSMLILSIFNILLMISTNSSSILFLEIEIK